MEYMFTNCKSLNKIDLSSFYTPELINMNYLFSGCTSLNVIDVSYLDTNKVKNPEDIFKELPAEGTITYSSDKLHPYVSAQIPEKWIRKDLKDSAPDASNIYLIAKYDVTSTSTPTRLFSAFASPPVFQEFTPYISSVWADDKKINVTNGEFQFSEDGKTTVKIYFKKEMEFLDGFFAHTSLVEIDLSHFDASQITSMSGVFKSCNKLEKINYGDKFNTNSLTSTYELFSGCAALTEIDLSQFNTTNVNNMDSMFEYCSKLEDITFGKNFKTSKVLRMRKMFGSCVSLTSIDLSSFDTSKVEMFESMFEGCTSLKSIDTEYIKTDSALDISGMFAGCTSLTSIDINFNMANIRDISFLFSGCSALQTVNFGKSDTKLISEMEYMFAECSSLKEIDLSTFNTPDLTNVDYLFYDCSALADIDISNLDTTNIEEVNGVLTDIAETGKITFNSEKCPNIVSSIPAKWSKNDIA
jgi:surface protein